MEQADIPRYNLPFPFPIPSQKLELGGEINRKKKKDERINRKRIKECCIASLRFVGREV